MRMSLHRTRLASLKPPAFPQTDTESKACGVKPARLGTIVEYHNTISSAERWCYERCRDLDLHEALHAFRTEQGVDLAER
eukprot:1294309-Amphidinium_carterae.1